CNPRWSPRNRVVRRDDGTRTIRDDTTGRIEVSAEITDGDVGGLSLLEVDVVRKVRPDAILVPVRNGVPTRDRPVGFSDTQTQRVDTSTPNSHQNKDGVWTDLTDYVHFEETQTSNITIGDFSRDL